MQKRLFFAPWSSVGYKMHHVKPSLSFAKTGSGRQTEGNAATMAFSFSFRLSLCLSRACLGKIIGLIYKWRVSAGYLAAKITAGVGPSAVGKKTQQLFCDAILY